MKNFFGNYLLLAAIIMMPFVSCTNDTKSKLIGTWKMADMKFQSEEQQQAMSQKQISRLQDSISKNTDTSKSNRFKKQLEMIERNLAEHKAKQDSSMKNIRWEFKSGGDFVASEMGTTKNGIWSYDEDKKILFTIIEKRTASVHVRFDVDTLTLQFDSLNYMQFTRAK